MTGIAEAHALVLAMDYRVPDPRQLGPLLQKRKAVLASLGAHTVVVYTSMEDHGRIMVTMGLRSKEPILEVLRSRVFLDWFDAVGLEDIPAIFAGETAEKLTITDPSETGPPGVIVAAIASVADVPTLIAGVRKARDRFAAAGVRAIRIFRAFDDDHEVLILQEIDNEADAADWVNNPDIAAEWMTGAGIGAYPPVFVGRIQHMMRIDENT